MIFLCKNEQRQKTFMKCPFVGVIKIKQFYSMQKDHQEEKNPYAIPIKRMTRISKRIKSHQQRGSNSLPTINLSQGDKVNEIRDQINSTKDQIMLIQARINSLKFEKVKFDKKKDKNEKQSEFVYTVRQRTNQKKVIKSQLEEQRKKELQNLKKRAHQFREQMLQEKKVSQSMIQERKSQMGVEERRRRQKDQQYIKHIKSLEIQENREKANLVKQEELEIQEKMKEFNESKVTFAKHNHQEKLVRGLTQKQKVQKMRDKLRKQQQQVLEECKRSEADMLKSFYALSTLNSSKKKRRAPESSRVTSIKYY